MKFKGKVRVGDLRNQVRPCSNAEPLTLCVLFDNAARGSGGHVVVPDLAADYIYNYSFLSHDLFCLRKRNV